jgi:CDP-diacylglycerol---serine O-phosphatidyltransferase
MSEDPSTPESPELPRRRRGIYLLPNLITTAALFAGFYAMIAANEGNFAAAAGAIFVAMVLDGMDGRIARLTNTQSDFGVQYDSIADMVSFGVAPALVIYQWALSDMAMHGPLWARVGWSAAFIYTACAGLRLARFNTQVAAADKRYFQGLPSPSAAGVVAGLVWVGDRLAVEGFAMHLLAVVLTVLAGILMVSNVRYHSFKEFDFRYRVPFIAIVALVLFLVFTTLHPPMVLFLGFLAYLASGPVFTVIRRRQHLQRRPEGGKSE